MAAVILYSERYHYLPLNEEASEIRLLTILPGAFNSEVRVVLSILPLLKDSTLSFEALSYTWGSPDNPAQVLVGYSGRRTISITRNLAEALPYLRLVDRPRSIWIDAICINQQDLAERSSQVLRMPDIYRESRRVVVWLGLSSPESSEAFDILHSLGSKVQVNWHNMTMEPSKIIRDPNESHWADVRKKVPYTESQLRAVFSLLYRPWFERLWVRQEVALASKATIMICGTSSLSWQTFRDAMFAFNCKPSDAPCYHNTPGLLETWMARRALVYGLCRNSISKLDFEQFFSQNQDTKCLDPRDRIYAMLSIFPPRFTISPDYAKSYIEVYKDFTLRSVRQSGYLNILTTGEMGDSTSSEDGRPSWVPDWSKPRVTNPLVAHYTSLLSVAATNAPKSDDYLEVTGVEVGKIKEVQCFDIANTEPVHGQPLSRIARLKANLSRVIRQTFKDENDALENMSAFCRTVCAGQISDRFHPPTLSYNSLKEARDALHGLLDFVYRSKPLEWTTTMDVFFGTLGHYCGGRSVFTTNSGKLGLGPGAVKTGDIVVVLLGCYSPMVLRPANSSQYQVVGEAYCEGIMNGEGLLGELPGNLSVIQRSDPDGSGYYFHFLDSETGKFSIEDPRLGDLPPGWRKKSHNREQLWSEFVRVDVGGKMKWNPRRDPRLEPEELRARGVRLQTYQLI